MSSVVLYTDGSCHGNPGPGGYAAIAFQEGVTKEVHGGDWYTSSNRMELMAVIEGLKLLDKPSKVKIVSDSQYVVKPIKAGKLKEYVNSPGRKNADLWQQILQLSVIHSLSAEWVKGHSGNKYNQMCDSMANEEARKIEKDSAIRRLVFKEMLLSPSIPAEEIAHKHHISMEKARKYQYLYLAKIDETKGVLNNGR